MKVFSRLLSLIVASVVVVGFSGYAVVHAAQLTVFAPMAAEYTIGGFSYTPPAGDGWRQVTSSTDTFHLVYAESIGEDAINTRVDVVAKAFKIPDPALVTDVVSLAQKSQAQQASERGDKLIAFSRVAPVPGAESVHSYAFRTQVGDQELQEIFFVVLADDKSEYFVAKVTTQEADYTKAPYFAPLQTSLASLKHAGPSKAPVPEKTD